MIVLDNTDLLVPYKSYYLSTGIMFGAVSDKKKQFQFELKALQNKNGATITSVPENVKSGGDLEQAYNICRSILEKYYGLQPFN